MKHILHLLLGWPQLMVLQLLLATSALENFAATVQEAFCLKSFRHKSLVSTGCT